MKRQSSVPLTLEASNKPAASADALLAVSTAADECPVKNESSIADRERKVSLGLSLNLDSETESPSIAAVTFFSVRHLCLHSKWLTVMEITDAQKRKNVTTIIFCAIDGSTILIV